jgi:hypothetical protein
MHGNRTIESSIRKYPTVPAEVTTTAKRPARARGANPVARKDRHQSGEKTIIVKLKSHFFIGG